jgi:hypothetical protein
MAVSSPPLTQLFARAGDNRGNRGSPNFGGFPPQTLRFSHTQAYPTPGSESDHPPVPIFGCFAARRVLRDVIAAFRKSRSTFSSPNATLRIGRAPEYLVDFSS